MYHVGRRELRDSLLLDLVLVSQSASQWMSQAVRKAEWFDFCIDWYFESRLAHDEERRLESNCGDFG